MPNRSSRASICAVIILAGFPGFAQLCPTATRCYWKMPRFLPALSAGRPCGVRRRSRTGNRSRRNSGQCSGNWHRAISGSPVSDVTLVNAVFVIAPASRLEELKSIREWRR